MEALSKFEEHETEIMQEMAHVQELMAKSEAGRYATDSAMVWAESVEMQDLLYALSDEDIPEEPRNLLMEYMNTMLQRDKVNGLKIFADYLESLVENPKYATLKNYHEFLSYAALNVYYSETHQDYITLQKNFENDNSVESITAKKAIKEMQEKIGKWMV